MNNNKVNWLSLERLTLRQWLNIKGSVVNIDNRTNKVFLSFNPFSSEFSPGDRLDVFPSYLFFHSTDKKSKGNIKAYICKLNKITLQSLADPKYVVVVLDTSIKNQVATSIVHIHIHNSPVIKTIHHAITIMITEAELFAIRCDIN